MSYELTRATKDALNSGTVEPNIVVEIDGIDKLFGVRIISHYIKYGEDNIYYGQLGLIYGGIIAKENQRDVISLSGTSDSFSQQLDPDKGAVTSSGTMTIRMIDSNLEITNYITPNSLYQNWDILYKNARVYSGLANLSFPEDYIELFNGKIMSVVPGPGYVDFTITHPEDMKRSDVFILAESKLVTPLTYYALILPDLIVQQVSDVEGIVSIQFIAGPGGDNATVTVSGNTITVGIDVLATKAKTVKKKIMNDENANQLVNVSINKAGDADNLVGLLTLQQLQVSDEIELESVEGFLAPTGNNLFKTYARINDEIIQYTAIDTVNKKLTGCVRASLTSLGANHEVDDDVSSFYKLGDGTTAYGNAIDLVLKILLSGGGYYATNVDAENFVTITPGNDIANAIYFKKENVRQKYGLVVGDYVTSSGATNAANGFVDRQITSFGTTDVGTYIVVNGAPLVSELNSPAVLSFKSKYDVLPDGVGLSPQQVAVDEMELVKSSYLASIANYEFYLKDTVDVKAFINEEILLPSAMYSVPRKGKISLKYTAPPLYDPNIELFNFDNVKRPEQLAPIRTVNRNFYNAIVFKFNEDSVTDKLINGFASVSASSFNRIDAPTKTFRISARGLRNTVETRAILDRNAKALLSRYQFAAESFNVSVPMRVGMNVEVGDIVIFGGAEFQMTDITSGTREFKERLFEVTNRSYNWRTGDLQFTIVDTNYSNNVRYATFSPTSKIVSGTVNDVIIEDSYGTLATPGAIEADKWRQIVGKGVMVHDPEWTTVYHTELLEIDSGNPYLFKFYPPLPAAPLTGWELDIAKYDEIAENDGLLKAIHLFWGKEIEIVTGISGTQFSVALGDVGSFFLGSLVQVFNDTHTNDSGTDFRTVTNITGTTITLDKTLGFTPSVGDKIIGIGFVSDNGKPYVWL